MCTPWRQAQTGSCSRARAQGVVLGLRTHSEESVPKYIYYINLLQRIRLRICAFCSMKGRNLPKEILEKVSALVHLPHKVSLNSVLFRMSAVEGDNNRVN